MNTQMTRREDAPAEARRQEFIRPYYEVEGDEHAYEVRVFLPGVPREQANITLEKDTLTVEASRVPHAAEGWRPQHREIATADYRLRLQLNLRVDEANIAASSQDGVLTIKLPVAEEAKPRSIAIN